MQDILILEIVSSRDKLLAKDIVKVLEISQIHKRYDSKYNLKKAVYTVLWRLTKKGLVIREKDYVHKPSFYRFTISDSGLDFLSNQSDIALVKAVVEKIS